SRIYVGQVLRIPAGQVPAPAPVPPSAENLSIIESNHVHKLGDAQYHITSNQPFYLDVAAPGATGVAFYLQDAWGGITLLGEDTYGGDGWGLAASIPQSPYNGMIYAIAYNAHGDVGQSKFLSVWR